MSHVAIDKNELDSLHWTIIGVSIIALIFACLATSAFWLFLDKDATLRKEHALAEQYRLENVSLRKRPASCPQPPKCGPLDLRTKFHEDARNVYPVALLCKGE